MALTTPESSNPQPQPMNNSTPPNMNYNNYGTPVFGLASQMAGMGSGGEYYEKLYSKLLAFVKGKNEESKDIKDSLKYGIQKLLKTTAGLNYSGIIMTQQIGDIVAAHVLVVERTGNYPDKLTENYNGVRYEIARTPGEALDKKYVDQTISAISNALKVPPASIILADGTLVPNEFDVDSDTQMAELINNTCSAANVEIAARVYNYRGSDLTEIIKQFPTGKFVINLHFNSEESVYLDQTGMPVRQDICVSLSFKTNRNGNSDKSINQGDDSFEIVRTYGYIDFEYVGPTVVNGVMSTQKFAPNFVITHIDATTLAPTPDLVMLAVASVLAINEDMAWTQAFLPTPSRKNETDYNDIGALNIDGNIEQSPTGYGKKYDTKSKTPNAMELNKFIQTLVRPVLLITIDVPKAGPETWFTSVFKSIMADGNTQALSRVNNFMQFATAGAYQPGNVPMFDQAVNKIHGGFYKDKDGFRDIRKLSCYLAVANYVSETGQQPLVLTQYTQTLYSNLPTVLRAASRRQYIDDMSKRTVQVKQMYDRMTFNGTFLANWVGALRSVGFLPVFNSGNVSNDMFTRRSTANFQSGMLQQDVRLMSQQSSMPGNWGQYGFYARQY